MTYRMGRLHYVYDYPMEKELNPVQKYRLTPNANHYPKHHHNTDFGHTVCTYTCLRNIFSPPLTTQYVLYETARHIPQGKKTLLLNFKERSQEPHPFQVNQQKKPPAIQRTLHAVVQNSLATAGTSDLGCHRPRFSLAFHLPLPPP